MTPDAVNIFSLPRGIALDSANGRALVIDPGGLLGGGGPALLAVDLENGVRTILSDVATTPDNANPFGSPGAIVVDSANDRALVIGNGLHVLLAVDLENGVRTILSDAMTPDDVNPILFPVAIALDGNRALVIDIRDPFETADNAVVAVDLASGTRTILSDATSPGPAFGFSGAIAVDSDNDRALMTSIGDGPDEGAVFAVDLTDGTRTILSGPGFPNDVNPLTFPIAIAVDSDNGRALVLDEVLQAVVAVDLVSGARTILSDATTPNDVNMFGRVFDIVVDSDNDRALVLDSGRPGVVAVDLATGARTIVSDQITPDAVNGLGAANAIALDGANNRALVTDVYLGVVAVELTSGDRVIVSKSGNLLINTFN